MTVEDLELLYDYSNWANRQMFRALEPLTEEQFTQSVGEGFGCIRDTLVHVVSAEWGWLQRCGGRERGNALKNEDFPTLISVIQIADKVATYVQEFLSQLQDTDLEKTVEFSNPKGEKRTMRIGEMLHHAANHGVHHRGQVVLILRLLGYTPDDFDLLFYYGAKHNLPVW